VADEENEQRYAKPIPEFGCWTVLGVLVVCYVLFLIGSALWGMIGLAIDCSRAGAC
jgi:hypothetical protein